MNRTIRALLVAVSLTAILGLGSGCGTVMTTSPDYFTTYAGTDLDVWVFNNSDGGDAFLAAMDMPFSFIADTALFPVAVLFNLDYENMVGSR